MNKFEEAYKSILQAEEILGGVKLVDWRGEGDEGGVDPMDAVINARRVVADAKRELKAYAKEMGLELPENY